jgi:hypothetical protein
MQAILTDSAPVCTRCAVNFFGSAGKKSTRRFHSGLGLDFRDRGPLDPAGFPFPAIALVTPRTGHSAHAVPLVPSL